MEITIGDFRKKFGFHNTTALLSVLYEKHPKTSYEWNVFIQNIPDRVVKLPAIEELLPLMSKVNKEVKHPSCPNNLKNRFYTKKTKVIKHLLANGAINSIIESDNLYNFVVGEYSFHQPKDYWKRRIKKIDGTEIYEATKESLPFEREDYDNFQLASVMYIAVQGKLHIFNKIMFG